VPVGKLLPLAGLALLHVVHRKLRGRRAAAPAPQCPAGINSEA